MNIYSVRDRCVMFRNNMFRLWFVQHYAFGAWLEDVLKGFE
ncbi:MAG: hypothetical protein WC222_11655 [Parachlamydiales bacterium]